MMQTQSKLLADLIDEFITDPEQKEVMLYVQSAQWFALSTEGSRMNQLTAVPNIPPEALAMYRRYSAGTSTNKFFHQNYAAITAATIMMDISAKTLFTTAKFGDENESAKTIARDQIANRYAAMTMVVFLAHGYDKAAEFDIKLKTIMRATEAEVEACKAVV